MKKEVIEEPRTRCCHIRVLFVYIWHLLLWKEKQSAGNSQRFTHYEKLNVREGGRTSSQSMVRILQGKYAKPPQFVYRTKMLRTAFYLCIRCVHFYSMYLCMFLSIYLSIYLCCSIIPRSLGKSNNSNAANIHITVPSVFTEKDVFKSPSCTVTEELWKRWLL